MRLSTCTPDIVTFAVIGVPIIILEVLAIYWLNVLRTNHTSCQCAQDWRLHYMFWYLLVAIIWTISYFGYRLYSGCINKNMVVIPIMLLSFAFAVASVISIVATFQYLHKLKKSNCTCALNGNGNKYLMAVAVFRALAFLLTLLLFVLVIVTLVYEKYMN